MPADVISFLEARDRLRLNRAGQAMSAEEDARAYWLADLATWPVVFQRKLRQKLEHRLDPRRVPDQDEVGAGDIRARRWLLRGYSDESYYKWLLHSLASIRKYAARLRVAKASNGGSRELECARRLLDGQKGSLLMLLWEFGHRRIERTDLRRYAEAKTESSVEWLRRRVAHLETKSMHLQRLIRGGVYERGPNAGKPYSERRVWEVSRELGRVEARLGWDREELAVLESESDPLRASLLAGALT